MKLTAGGGRPQLIAGVRRTGKQIYWVKMARINQQARAAKAWPVLVECARQRRTITYRELSDALGLHWRAAAHFLSPIQDYCIEADLPPLTILVVNASGLPGGGFFAWKLDSFEDGLQAVYDHQWSGDDNPFLWAVDGRTVDSLAKDLVNDPSQSEAVWSLVRNRGVAQRIFRQALLEAYDYQCAMCGLTFEAALDAAHISPWAKSSPSERVDPRNGILLCATHHRLYDSDLFEITQELRVEYYDPEQGEGPYSKADRRASTKLHGSRLRLPKSRVLWPLEAYLARRREE